MAVRRMQRKAASRGLVPKPAPIDGDRAFLDLLRLCELGPRPAGSKANDRQRALVARHFASCGATIQVQPFQAHHPLHGQLVSMANLIGSWNPARPARVLLGAHYDTRPHPDLDPDPRRRRLPFLGANDGASGVALLLEIARHLNDLPTPWGVDLVLFDGEELVFGQVGEYCLGSQHFAKTYQMGQESGMIPWTYQAAIVLDMVAGSKIRLNQERFSLDFAPELVAAVWEIARKLGANAFQDQMGIEVVDDHLPLIEVGIPAIDLIDIDFPHWHTTLDLPENCSAESLAEVGRVVTAWLASG